MRSMADDSQIPALERIHCNRCRLKTQHRLVATATDEGSEPDDYVGEISWRTVVETLQCCGCGEAVLRRSHANSEDPDGEIRYYPPPVSRHPPRWIWRIPRELQVVLNEVYHSLDANNLSLPMMGARTSM